MCFIILSFSFQKIKLQVIFAKIHYSESMQLAQKYEFILDNPKWHFPGLFIAEIISTIVCARLAAFYNMVVLYELALQYGVVQKCFYSADFRADGRNV